MDFERTLIASFEHHYNFYVPTIDLHEAFSWLFPHARDTDGRDKFEIGSGEARFIDYFVQVCCIYILLMLFARCYLQHGSGASEGVQCFPMSCGIAFNSLEKKFQDNKFVGSMALCIEMLFFPWTARKQVLEVAASDEKECSLKNPSSFVFKRADEVEGHGQAYRQQRKELCRESDFIAKIVC
uniref:Uncharacterized protein n=1 Tax=Ditylenchus dipsaci TaxID=166011 RepID=A0A915DJX9_9BILA